MQLICIISESALLLIYLLRMAVTEQKNTDNKNNN